MGKNRLIQIHLSFKTTIIGDINNVKKGQFEITSVYPRIYTWAGNEIWENIIVNKEGFYDNYR